MRVWLVAATSYYDDPIVHHIAATQAEALAWVEEHGGLDGLGGGYDYQPAVVLEWAVGSADDIESAVCRRRAELSEPTVP